MKNRTKILFIAFAALISGVACHAPKKCGCLKVVNTYKTDGIGIVRTVLVQPSVLPLNSLCCPDSGANTIDSPGYKETWKWNSLTLIIDTCCAGIGAEKPTIIHRKKDSSE